MIVVQSMQTDWVRFGYFSRHSKQRIIIVCCFFVFQRGANRDYAWERKSVYVYECLSLFLCLFEIARTSIHPILQFIIIWCMICTLMCMCIFVCLVYLFRLFSQFVCLYIVRFGKFDISLYLMPCRINVCRFIIIYEISIHQVATQTVNAYLVLLFLFSLPTEK